MASAFLHANLEGARIAFVPPRIDVARFGTVLSFQNVTEDECVVTTDSITTIQEAQELQGCSVLVYGVTPDTAVDVDDSSLVGYIVIDVHAGPVGTVVSLDANRTQPLLTVQRLEDPDIYALVPFVDELISEIDDDAQSIFVELPSGLLEM